MSGRIPSPLIASKLPQDDVDALVKQLAEVRKADNPWTPIVVSTPNPRARRRVTTP